MKKVLSEGFRKMQSYRYMKGPATWPKFYPQCGGYKQSPVDIVSSAIQQDDGLLQRPLSWKYNPANTRSLVNTGHGWKVEINGEGSSLTGGPLQHKYEVEQFHCHWGSSSDHGSEHTVNGKSYSGELHIVHWNTDLFKSFKDAAQGNQGLAVLGIFLQVGNEHQEFSKITDLLDKIHYKDSKTTLGDEVDPAAFLPESQAYWTYEGSLTTPPCNESVTWIVFKQPIQVSESQLNKMRQLGTYNKDEKFSESLTQKHVVENYRPPQPLNNRIIREASF